MLIIPNLKDKVKKGRIRISLLRQQQGDGLTVGLCIGLLALIVFLGLILYSIN